MTFSETALADHFVALGFIQAGTRFLVLRQKAAASDNSLGSIRLHLYPRPVYIISIYILEFGKVSLFSVCRSHSTALLSPHTHWPGTLFTFLPPNELLLPPRPAKSLPFFAAQRRTPCLLYFCLPPLSLRKSNAICSQSASLGGSHNIIFFKSVAWQTGCLNYWANFQAAGFRDSGAHASGIVWQREWQIRLQIVLSHLLLIL